MRGKAENIKKINFYIDNILQKIINEDGIKGYLKYNVINLVEKRNNSWEETMFQKFITAKGKGGNIIEEKLGNQSNMQHLDQFYKDFNLEGEDLPLSSNLDYKEDNEDTPLPPLEKSIKFFHHALDDIEVEVKNDEDVINKKSINKKEEKNIYSKPLNFDSKIINKEHLNCHLRPEQDLEINAKIGEVFSNLK